jgi:methyl-accepting chemotaxis protein
VIIASLPKGTRLSAESAAARHRINTALLWLQVPALVLFGLCGPMPMSEALLLPLITIVFAAAAAAARGRPVAWTLTSFGLISITLVGIEVSGGSMVAHFHIFVMIAFIALYQAWKSLLAAVLAIAVHHTVIGMLFPDHVFGMHMSGWPLIGMIAFHSGMLLLEVLGILVMWHFAEKAEAENVAATEAAEAERRAAEAAREEAAEFEALAKQAQSDVNVVHGLATQATLIRTGAEEIDRAVENVSVQMQRLTEAVQRISERAHLAMNAASNGRDAATTAAEEVQRLETAMTEIATVNSIISKLAAQTNLLSLNATIEAARAGEFGRGFAVVANEVKQLAAETSSSADNVNVVMDTVIDGTRSVSESFASTSDVVEQIHSIHIEIATSVDNQAAVADEVSRALANVTAATRSIMASIDELTATAGSL